MRKCIVCGIKSPSFYVSSEDEYLCPKHYINLTENEQAIFNKNKIVLDGNIAYMTIYNHQFVEKETVMLDAEDVKLVKHSRWHIDGSGHVITYVPAKKLQISKKTGLAKVNRLRLIDYIMYKNEGLSCPMYHTGGNILDCRKSNVRMVRGKFEQLSSVKHIL